MTGTELFFQTFRGQNKKIGAFLQKTASSGSASIQLVQQLREREEKQQKIDKIIRRIFK